MTKKPEPPPTQNLALEQLKDLGTQETLASSEIPPRPAQQETIDSMSGLGSARQAAPVSSSAHEAPRRWDAAPIGEGDPRCYERLGELARGGMGRISRARDKRLGRPVALKELLSTRGNATERFWREALITARLQHPAIVPVYEAGSWPSGEPFFSMKLVSGRPLDEVIAEKKTFAERIALLPTVIAVCEAMAYAHAERIIHRDLKPANILVGEYGETVVIDWGIAKDLSEQGGLPDAEVGPYRAQESASGLTSAGAIMGTPAYMSPEQALGKPLDARTDVYALGAMLYHLLAGQMPFSGKTAQEILIKVASGPPPPIERREPDIPQDLATIIRKAMAHSLEERYATANDLLRDLKSFQAGQMVGSHRYSLSEVLRRWIARNKAAVFVGLAALLIVAVGGFLSIESIIHAKNAAVTEKQKAEEERARAQTAQVAAEEERGRAERGMVALLAEQGRQELLAGSPSRAAAYLSEAYRSAVRLGDVHAPLRFLLAKAMRPLDAFQASFPTHKGGISSMCFSPDGKRILTTSEDKTAKIWDTKTRALLASLEGHEDGILEGRFSPDGLLIVTVSYKGVKLWEAETGKLLFSLEGHSGVILSARFSPDGTRLLTTSNDKTAKLWDTKTGAELLSLQGHTELVSTAEFSPDGQRIVTTSLDNTALVWDASTGERLLRLQGGFSDVYAARFSPDGERIAALTGPSPEDARRGATLWDAKSGAVIRVMALDTYGLAALQFSPDGKQIVTAHQSDVAILWNQVIDWDQKHLRGHTGAVNSAQFSPDGKRVVTTSVDNTAKVWDVETGSLLLSLEPPAGVSFLAKFSPDGALLATVSREGTIELWDMKTSILLASRSGQLPKNEPEPLSPDKALRVVIAKDGTNTARVQEESTKETVATLRGHAYIITDARFSPDSARVLTVGADKTVKLWEARTGQLLASIESPEAWVFSAYFSPDGAFVVTTHDDYLARLWDASTGKLLAVFSCGRDIIHAVQFSTDGARVTFGSPDGVIREWSLSGERRDPQKISDIVEERTSWRLVDGLLLPAERGVRGEE